MSGRGWRKSTFSNSASACVEDVRDSKEKPLLRANADYSGLSRTELEQRLAVAEDMCLMYGWSASISYESDRGAAAAELWQRWARHPGVSTDPKDHPELVGAEASLARARRETRAAVLRKILGEPA